VIVTPETCRTVVR